MASEPPRRSSTTVPPRKGNDKRGVCQRAKVLRGRSRAHERPATTGNARIQRVGLQTELDRFAPGAFRVKSAK